MVTIVHTNPPRKRRFLKTLFKSVEEFKNAGCSVDGKHFVTELLESDEVTLGCASLHGRGFQSKRFHDLETTSKTTLREPANFAPERF